MYCKAGFKHFDLTGCEHVVVTQGVSKRGFRLPDDFYSEETVALRREENRKKYQPTHRLYKPARKLVGNEVEEMF